MTELRCRQVQAVLDAYVEGELAACEALAVRAHLEGCGACRAEHKRMSRALAVLSAATPPAVPERVRRGVYARIVQQDARRPWHLRLRPALASAAVVGLVVVGFAMVRRTSDRVVVAANTPPTPAARSHPSPVEVLEQPASGRVAGDSRRQPASLRRSPPPVTQALRTTSKPVVHGRRNVGQVSPMPESFLDVADSRGITARDLIEARSGLPAILQSPRPDAANPRVSSSPATLGATPVPSLRTEEMLNERVRVGDSVTELHGVALWDANGRLRAMRVRAETVEEDHEPETETRGELGGSP